MALSSLGRAALEYAKRGWAVFPLIPRDKRPIVPDIYTVSSTDPQQIEAWWTLTPEANIGLDCGKSGVTAIDIDVGGDKPGRSVLNGLKLFTGTQAWRTWRSRTTTGGEHYLFAAPNEGEGEVRTGAARYGPPGVDIRAKGGYIVLPPSELPAGRYTLIEDLPPAPFPRSLLHPPRGTRDDAGRTELERELHEGTRISKGARDNFLTAVAGRLRRIGFEEMEIRAALLEMNQLRCDPPTSRSDIERIAASVCRYEVEETLIEDAARERELTGHWEDADQTVSVNAADFVAQSTEVTNWIVEGILQSTALNMLTGPPKAGKSTLGRRLALDVAFGLPFLGRFKTQASPVLYYTLQENKAHLRAWLLQALGEMDAPLDVPIDFVFRLGRRGEKAVQGLLHRCQKRKYGLVIIDMFGRFSGLRSLDDYAEVESMTDLLKDVADRTGACILWLHHDRKSPPGADTFAGALGSQAIRGAVYTTMKVWKESGQYYLATEQREGDDLADTVIAMPKGSTQMRASGGRLAAAVAKETKTAKEAAEIVTANPKITVRAFRLAMGGMKTDAATRLLRETKTRLGLD